MVPATVTGTGLKTLAEITVDTTTEKPAGADGHGHGHGDPG